MPANLTPEYLAAEQAYREAKTDEERLACLERMLAVIPKHKGTDHMQADLKRRIAKLRRKPSVRPGARHRDPFAIERNGAGQVVLLGPPNCGKSSLVGALTKARVNITDYPYGTHSPAPGMAYHEDVQIQLVDMPPVTLDGVPPGAMGAYRNADVILIVVDLSSPEALEQLEESLELLDRRGIAPVGRHTDHNERDHEGRQLKSAIIVGTKLDAEGARETFDALQDLYRDRLPILAVSAHARQGLQELTAALFRILDVIRVYSKEPGKPPDLEVPFILPRGSTVVDMARVVHRDFPERLKYACVWGSAKFDGQQVPRDHVLQDRDIVELHLTS